MITQAFGITRDFAATEGRVGYAHPAGCGIQVLRPSERWFIWLEKSGLEI